MRKTISVKSLIELVNKFNKNSADEYKSEREGKNMFLETILHETRTYEGFSYLSAKDLTADGNATSVGIREQKDDGTWNFEDTDHTRVEYYISRHL